MAWNTFKYGSTWGAFGECLGRDFGIRTARPGNVPHRRRTPLGSPKRLAILGALTFTLTNLPSGSPSPSQENRFRGGSQALLSVPVSFNFTQFRALPTLETMKWIQGHAHQVPRIKFSQVRRILLAISLISTGFGSGFSQFTSNSPSKICWNE